MHRQFQHQQGFGLLPLIAVIMILFIIYVVGNAAYVHFVAKQTTIQKNTGSSPLEKGTEYVAMGDSYSAGWGADRTPTNPTINTSVYDTSSKCYRSKKAAQYLVADDFDLKLIDASCGGATTEHIVNSSQQDQPPQISKLTSDTRLVTLTIGGNDTALLYALSCIQTSDCENNGLMTTLIGLRIAGLPSNLEKIYREITAKAPNVKIRHAGYPYIIPPPNEPSGTCSPWLSVGEQKVFSDLLVGTNNKIKETINKFVRETGKDVQYVDPLAEGSPFMQRDGGQLLDGCSTSMKRYMNGPNDKSEGSWHPNIYGQQMYQALYEASLRG